MLKPFTLKPLAKSSLQPINVTSSDFNQLRKEGFLLVDKTARINDLIGECSVFLSRPRRFGKSLLLSTITELFTNGVKSFEGLAVHDLWKRAQCPVVNISLFGMKDQDMLEIALCNMLRGAFAQAGFGDVLKIDEKINTISALTQHLNYVRGNQEIVLLIDEWDYPLSANLNDRTAFDKNKAVLNAFYAWIRDLKNIKFLLVTGIGRYQDTSLFTGQVVTDISMNTSYADLLGYTKPEVKGYFAEHITEAASRLNISTDELLDQLERQYDGFCFDENAEVKLYCPLSINQFFKQVADSVNRAPKFGFYWMDSANTSQALRTFLDRVHPSSNFIDDVKGEGVELTQSAISSATKFNNINLNALLVQTGYLTIDRIKNPDQTILDERICLCNFPNHEVELVYINIFLRYLTGAAMDKDQTPWFTQTADRLKAALYQHDMEHVVIELNVFLRAIPYDIWANATEVAYRTFICWCLLFSLKDEVRQETLNNKGRSDLEFQVGNSIYVIELKRYTPDDGPNGRLNLAAAAQQQVYQNGYSFDTYVNGDQARLGLALVVSAQSRQIEYWRYFDGKHVIAEQQIEPISMATPPHHQDRPDGTKLVEAAATTAIATQDQNTTSTPNRAAHRATY